MSTNKQALRGQGVDTNFYLAECCNCGQVMPSSKLIESRNYPDGDADCYCPHCNADDCDIDDMGSAASEAWNYQQKRIETLLDELEAADNSAAELNNELCNLLPGCQYMDPPDGGSPSIIEQVRRMVADYREQIEAAERRIAELTNPDGNAIAWESTTPVYIKFITDERYRRLRPGYQKWYKPYRCSNCAAGITVKGE